MRAEVLSNSWWIRTIVSLYSPSDRGFRNATSVLVRIRAIGVLNSWEASAVNCVTRLNALSNLLNISFKVSERLCSSSPVCRIGRRLDSSCSLIDCAARAISPTGATAFLLNQ